MEICSSLEKCGRTLKGAEMFSTVRRVESRFRHCGVRRRGQGKEAKERAEDVNSD